MLILSLTLLDFTGWPFVAACRVCRGTGMSRRAPSASAAVEDQQDSGHSKTCVFPAANMAIVPVQAYQNQRRIAMRRGRKLQIRVRQRALYHLYDNAVRGGILPLVLAYGTIALGGLMFYLYKK